LLHKIIREHLTLNIWSLQVAAAVVRTTQAVAALVVTEQPQV
jgi:hypothetical protein